MKYIKTLLIFILFFAQNLIAQRLTLSELHTFASNKNWESTNKNLISQGWEYFESTENDSIGYNEIVWSYKRNDYTEKASGWFHVYNFEGFPNKIMYRFRVKDYYTLLIKNLVTAGYKQTNEKIMTDRVIAYYENPSYFLQISYNKEGGSDADEDDYSYYSNNKTYTVYEVSLFKKGGFYDPNNGFKTDYDEYGLKTSTYTLKNGEFEGLYTSYDSIGRVIETTNYKKGIKEGISKIKLYLEEEGNYVEIKGNYKNNEQDGNWIGELITPTENKRVLDQYFINGKKEGLQKGVNKSIIYFENYKNNQLNGKSVYYRSLEHMLTGDIAHIDTIANKVFKIKELNYVDNKLNGKARYFDDFGNLESEGAYKDSLKTGLWKFYFPKVLDKNNKPVDYSGKLYLESNYSEGKLNGVEKRYAFLIEVEVPCDDLAHHDKDGFCYKNECFYVNETSNYVDDLLEGEFLVKDKEDEIIVKGNYSGGKKTGLWIEKSKSKICLWTDENNYETGIYVNGKKEFKWRRLDKNNTILESYTYSNNKLEGEHLKYINNKVVEKKYFKDGEFFKHEILNENSQVVNSITIEKINPASIDCKVEINNGSIKTKECFKYYVVDDFQINPITFLSDFENAKNNQKVLNGIYVKKTQDDKIIENGYYTNGNKSEKWDYYDYQQNVKLTIEYSFNNKIVSEYYYDLKKNEPFSGEYVYKNSSEYEERKIKDGLRNGTTRFKDTNGKTIKKESYKDGVIKE